MAKATATNTAARDNGFTAPAASWTFGMGTPEFHPRRKHWGPPAGIADRRASMYSGRRDHLHKWEPPRNWASSVRPSAEAKASAGINGKAHMATMDEPAQPSDQRKAEIDATIQRLAELLQIPAIGPAQAQPEPEPDPMQAEYEGILSITAGAIAYELGQAGFCGKDEATQDKAADVITDQLIKDLPQMLDHLKRENLLQMIPMPEEQRDSKNERRNGGKNERRSKAAKNADQSEHERKQELRAHYDKLDEQIKKAGGPMKVTPDWFEFTDASEAYQKIFFNGIRHGMPAYAAHNWATKKAYGKNSPDLI